MFKKVFSGRIKKTILCLLIVVAVFAGAAGDVSLAATTTYPLPVSNLLTGKIVFVDAGHGTEGSGFTGGSASGYEEHSIMLSIAKLLETNLNNLGATVILTRTGSKNITLAERVSIINKYSLGLVREFKQAQLQQETDPGMILLLMYDINRITELEAVMQAVIDKPGTDKDKNPNKAIYNDPYDYNYKTVIDPRLREIFNYCNHHVVYDNVVYISLHSNAASGSSANGVDVFYATNTYDRTATYFRGYSDKKVNWSRLYAGLLMNEVTAATGMKKNNITDSGFYMTRETNVPGVLIELGFHTNSSDRSKLLSDQYRKYMANGIALATLDYFKQTSGLNVPDDPSYLPDPGDGSGLIPEPGDGSGPAPSPVDAFVTRLYNNVLKRMPEPGAVNIWSGRLLRGEYTGTTIARGFFFSDEFLNSDVSNTVYVEILYETMLGRASEPYGRDAWISRLESDWSRERVFDGFAESAEFIGICRDYGIIP